MPTRHDDRHDQQRERNALGGALDVAEKQQFGACPDERNQQERQERTPQAR